MPVNSSYLEFVLEQLGRVASVSHRRMFGGVGLYADEWFFAVIGNDTLFFKVDDVNLPDFEAAGMPPFRPFGPDGKPMSYYQVPAEVIEDPDELAVWVRKAVEVSKRAGKKKRRKRKKGDT